MPKLKVNSVTMHYDQQGSGEPLILIPYLSAEHACYAIQVAEYAKALHLHLTRPAGHRRNGAPRRDYSTEDLADDVAGFMQALAMPRAHVAGLSLGSAVGMWLAAKYPDMVQSLSLHSGCAKTDPFITGVLTGWQRMATALDSVQEMAVLSMFPWCFSPELYAARPDYIDSLAAFVRSRPAQSVPAFIRQTNAVLTHDAEAQLGRITAPTQITFGAIDYVTSTRFADRLKGSIRGSELLVFDGCAHAPIYEKVEEFNQMTLQFLQRHVGVGAA